MAAPNVTGSLGLLLQRHTQLYGAGQPPLACTIKALTIQTADEAGPATGPDYQFGWGLVNARSAALLINENFTSQSLARIKEVRLPSGDFIEFPVVSPGNQPFKVTICWTDPPGTPPSPSLDPPNRMLVNDLDLRVVRSVTTYQPWILDPNNRALAATTGDNIRDNVEQVYIASPQSGQYLVRVTHKGNLVNNLGVVADQRVSIIISGDTPQPQPALAFSSITKTGASQVSLRWNSVVGRVYQVLYRDDVASGAWQNATGG